MQERNSYPASIKRGFGTLEHKWLGLGMLRSTAKSREPPSGAEVSNGLLEWLPRVGFDCLTSGGK